MLNIAVVDLFCGAAGLSYGLKQSGLKVVGGIDLDPACRYPFERNIGAQFYEEDIRLVSAASLRVLFGQAPVRVLAGCAPCQPFSGYTTKRRAIDGRWELLLEFLRLVKETRPEIVTLKNVPRLAHLGLWSDFVSALENDDVSWAVLDLSNFGVPQRRRRLVLLASKLGPIDLPKGDVGRSHSVRSVIGHLPAIKAGAMHSRDPLHAIQILIVETRSKRNQGANAIGLRSSVEYIAIGGDEWPQPFLPENCLVP